jgi:menaquinone-dependent protoporphyrinogen IX oxidase
MKRSLIIYGTRKGTTEKTAAAIAETLILKFNHHVEMINIRKIRRYRRRLNEFDILIVGTSIIWGRWVNRVLRFLKRLNLPSLKVAIFVTAGITLSKASNFEISKEEAIQEAIRNYIDKYQAQFRFRIISKMAFGGMILKNGTKKIDSWNREDIKEWAIQIGELLNSN